MNKELICYITKNGYGLDWHNTDLEISKASLNALTAFYEDHLKDPHKALFDLGFVHMNTDMSESVEFLHKISENYAQSFSKTPEI